MAPKTQDRAKQILHLLLQKGQSCVEDLAVDVDASRASVRRDLIKLAQRGLVHRSHGGVELAGKMTYEPFRFDAAFPLQQPSARCSGSSSKVFMVKHAKQVIAVADASKLGMFTSSNVCATNQLNTIITDDSVDPELVEAFQRRQVRVIVV
jgi:DeoR/GlpR family transcriptional regulator of sugar metabolism